MKRLCWAVWALALPALTAGPVLAQAEPVAEDQPMTRPATREGKKKDAAAIEKRADTAYEAGEYQEAMRRYGEATYWYEKLGKLTSWDRTEFKRARAQLYVALKGPGLSDTERTEHYTAAIARLRRLLRRSPKYADPHRLLCDIAWGEALRGRQAGSGPWVKIVQQCTKLLEIDPNDHQGFFRRGYAHARLAGIMKGKYVAVAEADMRKAIALKKDIPTYWMELTRFLQRRKRIAEADKAFRDAMTANPDSAELVVMYTVFLRGQNRDDEALKQLKQLIKRQPKDTLGFIALTTWYKAEGDTGEALRILEIAKKIDDTDYRIYRTMASIFAERREPKKIVQTLRAGLAAIKRRSQTQPATAPAEARERLKNAKLQLTAMLANALLDMVDAGSADRDKLMTEVGGYFSQIEKLAPNSPLRAKVAGRIALAKGDVDRAVRELEEAYAGFRTLDAKTVSLLVSLYLRQGLRGKAEAILDRVLRVRKTASALMLKAGLLIEYRQYDKAKKVLREALRIDPRHVTARNLLMALLAADRGGPLPDDLVATQRTVSLLLNRAAEMMLLPDQRRQGVELLEELYKKAPTDELVISRLVNVYLAQGQADKAKAIIEAAIKAQPDRADRFKAMLKGIGATPQQRFDGEIAEKDRIEDKLQRALAKATICATAKKEELWLKYLKEAEAIAPKDARVIAQMFRYGLSTKNWKITEDCVAKAKAANLDGCGGRLYAADVAIAKEDFAEAVAELKAALKARPDMRRTRVKLGQCYLRLKQLDKASEAFAAVARDDPGYAPAAIGMAMVAEAQGKWPEHTEWVKRAYRLAPTDPYINGHIGLITEEQAKPEEMIKRREQILRQRPGDMQNRLRLGALYERMNRLREAENAYRAVFASNLGTRRFRAHALAGFYARQNRLSEVHSIYKTTLANVTDTAEKVAIYVDYGWLLSDLRPDMAIAAFNKAIEVKAKDPRGHLALGRYLGEQRQWAKAAEAITRYVKLRPDDRATRRRLAGYLIEAQRFEEAAGHLDKLLAADASDAIAMTLKAVMLMRQGDFKAAEKTFNQVITENPNYGAALVNRAQLHLFQGEHAKAKTDLRAAGRLTNSPEVLVQLGRFYLSFREYDSARQVFQDILSRNKNYAPAIDGLISVYMAQKSWPRLEALLDRARKAYPKDIRYPLHAVRMWNERGDKARAAAAAAEAVKMSPNSPRAVMTYLQALLSAKEYKKTLEVSQPYVGKKGFASWVAAIRAHALVKMEKPAEAEKLFTGALQRARSQEMTLIVQQIREAYGLTDAIVKLTGWLTVRPRSWDICLLLGNLQVQAKQTSQGIKSYENAFEFARQPSQKAEAKARIGTAYYKLGKFADAEKGFLEALKIAPKHAATLNNLAYLYVNDMKQPAKAQPYATRAFKRLPNDQNVLDTYGWVLAKLGEYAKAEQLLNRALQMGTATPGNLYHLGWVHEKTGRVKQATMRYQQALKLLADDEDKRLRQTVTKALERLKKPGR